MFVDFDPPTGNGFGNAFSFDEGEDVDLGVRLAEARESTFFHRAAKIAFLVLVVSIFRPTVIQK